MQVVYTPNWPEMQEVEYIWSVVKGGMARSRVPHVKRDSTLSCMNEGDVSTEVLLSPCLVADVSLVYLI